MSLQSWKEEFYKKEPKKKMSKKEAVFHSLTKWNGLLPKNMKKHELIIGGFGICDSDGNTLYIGSGSCSLCVKYRNLNYENPEDGCSSCPIVATTGKTCFSGNDSAWMQWIDYDNPQKMIDLLTLVNNSI